MTQYAAPHSGMEARFNQASLYDNVDDSVDLYFKDKEVAHVQIMRGADYGGRTQYSAGIWLTETTMWQGVHRLTYKEAARDALIKLIGLGRY